MKDPCECRVKLSEVARIAEISLVCHVAMGVGRHYGICVNVKLNLAIKISEANVSFFVM